MVSGARAEGPAVPQVTLGDDYHCPEAPPVGPGPDGTWVMSDARRRRIDCMLAGAQAELDDWRPSKDHAPPSRGFSLQPSHGVFALVSAVLTTYLAIVKSRADRNCRGVLNPLAGC